MSKELARFVFRFCIRVVLFSHSDLNPSLLFLFGKSWAVNNRRTLMNEQKAKKSRPRGFDDGEMGKLTVVGGVHSKNLK